MWFLWQRFNELKITVACPFFLLIRLSHRPLLNMFSIWYSMQVPVPLDFPVIYVWVVPAGSDAQRILSCSLFAFCCSFGFIVELDVLLVFEDVTPDPVGYLLPFFFLFDLGQDLLCRFSPVQVSESLVSLFYLGQTLDSVLHFLVLKSLQLLQIPLLVFRKGFLLEVLMVRFVGRIVISQVLHYHLPSSQLILSTLLLLYLEKRHLVTVLFRNLLNILVLRKLLLLPPYLLFLHEHTLLYLINSSLAP